MKDENVIAAIDEIDGELAALEIRKQELIHEKNKITMENPFPVLEHDQKLLDDIDEILEKSRTGIGVKTIHDAIVESSNEIFKSKLLAQKKLDVNLIEVWVENLPEDAKKEHIDFVKKELSYFKTEENFSDVAHEYNFIATLYFDYDYKPEEIISKVEKDLAEIEN